MKTAPEILLDLVSIPSVSSISNRPVIEYALGYLNESDWRTELHCYRDQAGTEKVNLVARTKNHFAETAELTFVCHTDTVPFDPNWSEAVHPVLRDGKVFGRGSCDVKGFLACALEALSKFDSARLRRPLALVLTSDEEIGCVGAKYLVRQGAIKSRYVIIGEPTGLAPVRAGKGYGLAEIVVSGKEAHSAFPQSGRSAIRDAARVIERLETVAEQLALTTNPDFDPPFTTVNVGLIQGGTAKNIVPGECRITVEWRPVPGEQANRMMALIQQTLEQLTSAFLGFHAKLEVSRLDPAFNGNRTGTLTTLIESLTGRGSTTIAFGTEAAHLAPIAFEVIVFGPGDMTVAHNTGEFVPVEDLEIACLTSDQRLSNSARNEPDRASPGEEGSPVTGLASVFEPFS